MKKKILVSTLILLSVLCLLVVINNFGQECVREREMINGILNEHRADIGKWETRAGVFLALTIIVGVLGVVTGVLQKFDKKWCKVATIIVGAVITSITIINNTAFNVDHRAYLKRANQARLLIDDINLELARCYPEGNEEARKDWFSKIQEKIHKLHEIPELTAKVEKINTPFSLVSTAYAQTRQGPEPYWLSKLPVDQFNLYFVGVGDSASIEKAKDYAISDAYEWAVNYLISQFEMKGQTKPASFDVRSLSEYLANYGEVWDTYFLYDDAKKFFRYYVLFRLNKLNAETDIEFFSIKKEVYIPKALSQVIRTARELPADYYQIRIKTRLDFLNSARELLSPEKYEKFMEGHKLRLDKEYEKAAPLFEQVIRESPGYFFGWYDLALAYDGLKDFARASQSFERAAELELTQPVRNGSFYIAYGDFLFRNQKYTEAIIQLRKALEIDPNNQKIASTLEAAEKALER